MMTVNDGVQPPLGHHHYQQTICDAIKSDVLSSSFCILETIESYIDKAENTKR